MREKEKTKIAVCEIFMVKTVNALKLDFNLFGRSKMIQETLRVNIFLHNEARHEF